MKGFVRISELGRPSTIKYRAEILGIKPLEETGFGEISYSIADAERILAYKPRPHGHNIIYYEPLEMILNDDKLRYNTAYAAKIIGIKEGKLQDMLDEYNKEKCFIAVSKINNNGGS
jgi:hypothetical protein